MFKYSRNFFKIILHNLYCYAENSDKSVTEIPFQLNYDSATFSAKLKNIIISRQSKKINDNY